MQRLVKPYVEPKPRSQKENGWIVVSFADHSIPVQRQWGSVRDVVSVKKFWQSQVLCGVVVEFEGKQSVDVLALILAPEKTSTLQTILA